MRLRQSQLCVWVLSQSSSASEGARGEWRGGAPALARCAARHSPSASVGSAPFHPRWFGAGLRSASGAAMAGAAGQHALPLLCLRIDTMDPALGVRSRAHATASHQALPHPHCVHRTRPHVRGAASRESAAQPGDVQATRRRALSASEPRTRAACPPDTPPQPTCTPSCRHPPRAPAPA